jgi:ribosome-binding protein aMBF1 (putative translation factor)
MTPDEFRQAQARLGLSDAELAERLRSSENMVRRYKSKGARGRVIPEKVEALLAELAGA